MKTQQSILYIFFLCLLLCAAVIPVCALAPQTDVIFVDKPELPRVLNEDFSDGLFSRSWVRKTLVGHYEKEYYKLDRHFFSFLYPDYPVVGFVLNEQEIFDNVKIEASVRNVQTKSASCSLVCRADEDGWYELRVQMAGKNASTWQVLRYDPSITEQQGSQFIPIHPDAERFKTDNLIMGPNQVNEIGFSCLWDSFQVYINGVQQITEHELIDNTLVRGNVGFGVQSDGDGKTQIDYLKFSAAEIVD